MEPVTITSKHETWRLRCPHGHRTIEATNSHWWCQRCAQRPDVDPEYDEIVDDSTGRRLSRDDVRFDVDSPKVPA